MERETTRAARARVPMDPRQLDRYRREDGMWAETDEQRADRLERAICRDALLDWVRARLGLLREPQRLSIELHYFEGLTYEQAGQRLGKASSTVKRAEKRAIRALRALKRSDESWILYCEIYRFGARR